jgi:amino acid permease
MGSSIWKALILRLRLLLLFIPAMATFEMQLTKGFANPAAATPSSPVIDANDRVRVDASGMATGTEADAWDMARMGRSQELRRNFKSLSVLGLATTTMSTWVALLVTNAFSLTNGGLAGTVWVYLATWICTFALAASLAEMASMAPTSGGQYRESLFILAIQQSIRRLTI